MVSSSLLIEHFGKTLAVICPFSVTVKTKGDDFDFDLVVT